MLEEASVVTVDLSGEFDIGRTAELRDAILRGHGGVDHVVVDLTDVTFMDSSALRALLEVRGTLTESGSVLTLTNARPALVTLFEVTGMAEMFGL
jgi:anti-sigma B factor antagonist